MMLRTRVPFSYNTSKMTILDDSFFDYIPAPDTVDWRLNGSVSPVQNQASHDRPRNVLFTDGIFKLNYLKLSNVMLLSEEVIDMIAVTQSS
jgi:hypothetical protein